MKQGLFLLVIFALFTFLIFCPIFWGRVNVNGHLLVSLNPIYGENISFKDIGYDQLRIYYPTYRFTVDQFKNFKLPLWNPYSFAGQPHVGQMQSAVFYPLNIFSLFLPFEVFWNFLRISPSIIGAFFAYLYLKRLKLASLSAFFGALSFGLSPFLLTWGEEQVITPHAVIWLPLALYAVEGLRERRPKVKKHSLLLLAVSIAASVLAGFVQLTLYLLLFVFAYSLVVHKLGKEFFQSIIAFLFGILFSFIQLLPSIELYLNSPRSSDLSLETGYKFLLPVYSLFSYLAPDLFGHPATNNFFRGGAALYYEGILFVGIAVFIFALFAIFYIKSKIVLFFSITLVVCLALVVDGPIARLVMNLPLPILSSSIPNRILFIPAFCLVVLGAIGFDWWQKVKEANFKKILAYVFLVYVFLFAVSVFFIKFGTLGHYADFVSTRHGIIAFRNLVLPFGAFLATGVLILIGGLAPFYKRLAAIFIIVIAFANTLYFANKFLSFTESQFVFPKTAPISFLQDHQGDQRVWAHSDSHLKNNFALYYFLNWPEGYISLFNKSYASFVNNMLRGSVGNVNSRADVILGAFVDANEVVNDPRRIKLFNLLGIKYILTDRKSAATFKKGKYREVFRDGNSVIFENEKVLPRVFLASSYEGPPDIVGGGESEEAKKKKEVARRELIVKKLQDLTFDYRNVIILEKPSPISPQFGQGRVEVVKDLPTELVIKTSSEQPKLLYVADNYFPGWKVTVDGNETEIFRANYTFRAVPLTPGEHTVTMSYDPLSFKLGAAVSLFSIASVLLFLSRKRSLL